MLQETVPPSTSWSLAKHRKQYVFTLTADWRVKKTPGLSALNQQTATRKMEAKWNEHFDTEVWIHEKGFGQMWHAETLLTVAHCSHTTTNSAGITGRCRHPVNHSVQAAQWCLHSTYLYNSGWWNKHISPSMHALAYQQLPPVSQDELPLPRLCTWFQFFPFPAWGPVRGSVNVFVLFWLPCLVSFPLLSLILLLLIITHIFFFFFTIFPHCCLIHSASAIQVVFYFFVCILLELNIYTFRSGILADL